MPDSAQERAPWLTQNPSAWFQSVHHWLRQVSETQNLGTVVRVVEVKARPWSMVLRVELARATAYFKACGAGARWEPALLAYLAGSWPRQLPRLLAVEEVRSWMLMADCGQQLRASASPVLQVELLKRMLPLYAELQLQSRKSVTSLLGMGLPDRRLDRLPELLETLLSTDALQFGRSQPDAEQLRVSVEAKMPGFRRVCAELSDSAYAAALDHGDLHTGNLLINGQHVVLCDWGDACITHPFCSLLVMLESALPVVAEAGRSGVEAALVDAYLEPWTALASRATLVAGMQRVLWVAHVLRVLDFAHMFQGDDEESTQRWRPLIGDRLRQWLQAPEPD